MARQKITEYQKKEIIGMYAGGVLIKNIAEKYGVDVYTVNRYVNAAGIKKRCANKKEVGPKILKAWEEGERDYDKLAEIGGCQRQTVYSVLKRNGIKYETKECRRTLPYDKIAKLMEKGESVSEISKKLDIHKQSIYSAVNVLKREKAFDEMKRMSNKRKCKRMTINVGDKIEYLFMRDYGNDCKRVMTVEQIQGNHAVCRHKTGFVETFTATDMSIMFKSGKMRLLQEEI